MATAFLAHTWHTDIGFTSQSAPLGQSFAPDTIYRTTFTPSLILGAIANTPAAKTLGPAVAQWLLAQKNEQWSWNYWAREAPEHMSLPYPDDLDDTFCALIALQRQDSSYIDGAALGNIVHLLVATETTVGGPYRTWLVGDAAPAVWQDVDLAVNCNVAMFLQNIGSPLPNLEAYMDEAIAGKHFRSPYYPSEYPLLYYLSRAYKGPRAAELAAYILKLRRKGHWGTPLQTALAMSALRNLGSSTSQAAAASYLHTTQQADGSWPAEPFCIDPARRNQQHANGAAALTTAFAIEALTTASTPPSSKPGRPRVDPRETTLQRMVYARAANDAKHLPQALRQQMLAYLRRVQRSEHSREITLLPYIYAQSLTRQVNIGDTQHIQLGLANLYGWLAYTIFDDFLDDEGKPAQLPLATTALRHSVMHFEQCLPDNSTFTTHTQSTFDTIDNANIWEVTNCRATVTSNSLHIDNLPDYTHGPALYERSLGHSLTPCAVTLLAGYTMQSPEAKAVQHALQHYLAARQLNDDLHDWQDDTRRGHISFVTATILQGLGITTGNHSFKRLLPRMQEQFWRHSLPLLCKQVSEHTAAARQALRQSAIIKQDSPLEQLMQRLDDAIARTLAEHADAEAFLAGYKS